MFRPLKVGIFRAPYAGNGGCQSEMPAVGDFVTQTVLEIVKDRRCSPEIARFTKADTPITMVRNLGAKWALTNKVDALLMIDSDMTPDVHIGEPQVKGFWKSSFDFFCEHYHRGPCMIGAPYTGVDQTPTLCGEDNVFVFEWSRTSNDPTRSRVKVDAINRIDACRRVGIEEVAAIGTGLILIDTRVFLHPDLPLPWFDYEWTDKYQTEKGSTEDVYFTRNCSLLRMPVYCNWDAWAGHNKPCVTGKPLLIATEDITVDLTRALSHKFTRKEGKKEINPGKSLEEIIPGLRDGSVTVIDDRAEQSQIFADQRMIVEQKPNGAPKRRGKRGTALAKR